MIKVNIFEIKAKLSAYLDRVARGDSVIIYRHNKPVAELRGVDKTRAEPRPIGPLPGRPTFKVSSSFFDPLPSDELDSWEGLGPATMRSLRAGNRKGSTGRSRKG